MKKKKYIYNLLTNRAEQKEREREREKERIEDILFKRQSNNTKNRFRANVLLLPNDGDDDSTVFDSHAT